MNLESAAEKGGCSWPSSVATLHYRLNNNAMHDAMIRFKEESLARFVSPLGCGIKNGRAIALIPLPPLSPPPSLFYALYISVLRRSSNGINHRPPADHNPSWKQESFSPFRWPMFSIIGWGAPLYRNWLTISNTRVTVTPFLKWTQDRNRDASWPVLFHGWDHLSFDTIAESPRTGIVLQIWSYWSHKGLKCDPHKHVSRPTTEIEVSTFKLEDTLGR